MAFHVLSTVCNLGAFVYPVGPEDRTGASLREEMNKVNNDYVSVTEIAGDEVTQEQVDRLCNRYYWAGSFCNGKDVVEAACGSGQGLGYLTGIAGSLEAGDYSDEILSVARRHDSMIWDD